MFAVVMEFLVWLADFLFSKRKNYHGRHWADTVSKVDADYHPMPELCAYPGLWEARCSGHLDYLRVPLKVFYPLIKMGKEIDRTVRLSNYQWRNVPLSEWPENWRFSS
jgi:hypothetical protein